MWRYITLSPLSLLSPPLFLPLLPPLFHPPPPKQKYFDSPTLSHSIKTHWPLTWSLLFLSLSLSLSLSFALSISYTLAFAWGMQVVEQGHSGHRHRRQQGYRLRTRKKACRIRTNCNPNRKRRSQRPQSPPITRSPRTPCPFLPPRRFRPWFHPNLCLLVPTLLQKTRHSCEYTLHKHLSLSMNLIIQCPVAYIYLYMIIHTANKIIFCIVFCGFQLIFLMISTWMLPAGEDYKIISLSHAI